MKAINLEYKYTLVENKDSSSNPFFVSDINTLDFDLFSNKSPNSNNNFYHESSNSKKEAFLDSMHAYVTPDIKVFEESVLIGSSVKLKLIFKMTLNEKQKVNHYTTT